MGQIIPWVFLAMIISGAAAAQPTPVSVSDPRGKPIFHYTESHALVVGVSNYDEYHKLPGVHRDVVDVARALAPQGFDVVTLEDPTLHQLEDKINEFIDKYGGNRDARLLFYLAGHGETYELPDGRKMGYFLARDAHQRGDGRPPSNALALERVRTMAKEFSAKHALFVFDACFAGAVLFRSSDPVPSRTALLDDATNRPVRYFIASGTANQRVPDDSIFRAQFIAGIAGAADSDGDGYVTGQELGLYLRQKVNKYTGSRQTPVAGPLDDENFDQGDFVFTVPRSDRAMQSVRIGSAASGGTAGSAPKRFDIGITSTEFLTADDGTPLVRRVLETRSIADIEAAARTGDGQAQYVLGIAKWIGIRTAIDLPAARGYLREAVLNGSERAILAYGNMLYLGVGGPKSVDEAVDWWRTGDRRGNAPCTFRIGQYLAFDVPANERSFAKARPYFERAAKQGHVGAEAELADDVWFGRDRPVDRAAALKLFEQAKAHGSTRAIRRLADAYRHGIVYPADKPRALELLRDAARRDDQVAVIDAARMLIEGEAGKPDPQEAARLLEQAVDRGDWQAADLLAGMLIKRKVSSPHRDPIALARSAEEHGFPEALIALVSFLREGSNGWPKDPKRAVELARPALARARQRPLSEEGAWPVYQKELGYHIQKAIAEGVGATPGEAQDLERRFGKLELGMKKFSFPVDCDGIKTPFDIYLWDAPEAPVPTDDQIEWIEKARGCKVDPEVSKSFRKLFELAKQHKVSFMELCVYAINEVNKKPAGPPPPDHKPATSDAGKPTNQPAAAPPDKP